MTPTEQAARVLADVPRFRPEHPGVMVQTVTETGIWVDVRNAIAAIARHIAPGDDLVERLNDPWQHSEELCREAAACIAALTATVERRGRMHKSLSKRFAEANSARKAAEAENARLRARLARMEGALRTAEAALADIGDAEREPNDDLAWCERRAADALPWVRAALTEGETE